MLIKCNELNEERTEWIYIWFKSKDRSLVEKLSSFIIGMKNKRTTKNNEIGGGDFFFIRKGCAQGP